MTKKSRTTPGATKGAAKPHDSVPDVAPPSLTQTPSGYAQWLGELKARIRNAQLRASLAVNQELVVLYWQIGCDVLQRQAREGWGAKVVDRLAHDLQTAFPEMRGFSPRNLKYMRAFAEAWPDGDFVQQAAARLPWFRIEAHPSTIEQIESELEESPPIAAVADVPPATGARRARTSR